MADRRFLQFVDRTSINGEIFRQAHHSYPIYPGVTDRYFAPHTAVVCDRCDARSLAGSGIQAIRDWGAQLTRPLKWGFWGPFFFFGLIETGLGGQHR